MSLIIKDGATSLTVVGGADQTFVQDGRKVVNGVNYVDTGEPDFFERDTIALKAIGSNSQSDGTYSKEKREVLLRDPYTDADYGNQVVLVRIYVEAHPNADSVRMLNARLRAAQILSGTSFTTYWTTGALNI